MKYFNTLPTIINVNDNGSAQILKNLVVRNKLIDTLLFVDGFGYQNNEKWKLKGRGHGGPKLFLKNCAF